MIAEDMQTMIKQEVDSRRY